MKCFAIIGFCAVSIGLGTASAEPEAVDLEFDAKVKLSTEEVKKAWPVGEPKSREFYKVFTAMRVDFEQNNPWLFENANWPAILRSRAERELKMRRVRNAGKNPTFRSPKIQKGSALGKVGGLETDVELHKTYDRKNGERRERRDVRDYKGSGARN